MLDALVWFVSNVGLAFFNLGYALTHPQLWLGWLGGLETVEAKESLMRFIYYGASRELFFVVLTVLVLFTAVAMRRRALMWGAVRVLEGFANGVGRFFAWAGLVMVLQQIVIVFVQRIFASPDITIGLGTAMRHDISWWAEELKLYNALIVALCATYTFAQGGHVRVDLIYAAVSFRKKKLIDMFGSLFFMVPMALLTWLYAWNFMWRHLITPKVSASDKLDMMLRKARIVKWNVETIGFSPNGFNAYFLFKVLIVAFTGMVFIHAIAFFYRSYLEYVEGEESEGKYLDRDWLEPGEVEMAAPERLAHEHPRN